MAIYKPKSTILDDDDDQPDAPEGPVAPDPTDPNAPIPPAEPPPPTPPADTYQPPVYHPPTTPPESQVPETPTYTPEQLAAMERQKQANAATAGNWNTGGYAQPGYTAPNYNQTTPAGFDPAKWTDPTHQTPKYVVGRILSAYNLNDPTQLQQAMADVAKAYPGTTWGGKDTVNIPGIGEVDLIRDFGGESGIQWGLSDGGGGAGGGAMAPLSSGALGLSTTSSAMQPWYQQGITPSTSSTTGSTTASSGSSDPALENARRAALLELLGRKPPTAEELRNTPENQAYQLQSQRAEERQRAELAEKAAYGGFDKTGYFDTELQGIRQQRAEGEAGFLGELAVSRMQAQREDLQFAISEAQQAGQFDLAQQLQRQSMDLDAALRREQMASSERMAANELALRDFLGRAGIDLDRLRLGEDQRQFNYDLGYRYSVEDENKRQFNANYGLGPG